jgi:hypothetical protein
MFLLWNETDGVYASPDEFKTEGEAGAYAREFRRRFAAQGYDNTSDSKRISPEDIELVVEPVKT